MRIFIFFSQSIRKLIYESISYTFNKDGYHVLTSSIIYVLLKISIKTKHKNIFPHDYIFTPNQFPSP